MNLSVRCIADNRVVSLKHEEQHCSAATASTATRTKMNLVTLKLHKHNTLHTNFFTGFLWKICTPLSATNLAEIYFWEIYYLGAPYNSCLVCQHDVPCLPHERNMTCKISVSSQWNRCKRDVTPVLMHRSWTFFERTHLCQAITSNTDQNSSSDILDFKHGYRRKTHKSSFWHVRVFFLMLLPDVYQANFMIT